MKYLALTALLSAAALSACSPSTDTQGEDRLHVLTEEEPEKALSCTWPVSGNTPAALLRGNADFKARDMTIPGPEGTEFTAVVLYPDTPEKRIEVIYWDAAMEHVSTVRMGAEARLAGPEGIRLGNTVTDVEAANGAGFDLTGFGWDYGGYVQDWRGGKLAALEGGCVMSVRFMEVEGETPPGVSGDGVTVKSEGIRSWNPQVSEISVGWPLPAGVTPQ